MLLLRSRAVSVPLLRRKAFLVTSWSEQACRRQFSLAAAPCLSQALNQSLPNLLSRRTLSTAPSADSAEVWSFNLRTEFREDEDGSDGWSKRRQGVAELIGSRRPALVCVQEATEAMLEFVGSHLGSEEYGWIAVSRTPGEKDEAAGFLFDRRRLDLLAHEATWLGPPETPRGKPAWDAACARTFEMATFRVRQCGAEDGYLRALNTHFDHEGVQARTSSAEMLAAAVEHAAAKFPHCAHVVTGDFNSPKGFGNAAYQALTSVGASGVGLRDVARAGAECKPMPVSTIHKFEGVKFDAHGMGDGTVDLSGGGASSSHDDQAPDARHIDWILWRDSVSGLRLRPSHYEVITDRLAGSDSRYPSDHYPLSVVFDLRVN